jgi:hypothetical protein
MSTPPTEHRPADRTEMAPPAPVARGWLRRLLARISAAVRAAHSASVPF